MRRLGCALLFILCLASPSFAGAAQPHPTPAAYFWDLNDREITSVSSGTRGTVSRAEEPQAFEPQYDRDYGPFVYGDRTELSESLAHVMEDSQVRRFVTEWTAQVGLEFWGDTVPYGDGQYFPYSFCGNLLQYKVEKDGFVRMAVYDLVQKRQLSLSDFFYDGFNYIDYINRTIASYQPESFDYAYYYGDDYRVYRTLDLPEAEVEISLSEADFDTVYTKRPFTGLPRDYPLFAWMPGALVLYFEDYNPFWTTQYGLNIPTFLIPLTADISPWPVEGDFSGFSPLFLPIQFRYERVETGRGQPLILSLFERVGDTPVPEAINASLLATFARAVN
nr:hypothetical protein [Clostridia bacterium]